MAKKEYLLKIGDRNVSQFIIAGTYDCNQEDITKSYTDANYRVHASVVAQKIFGSCIILLSGEQEVKDFLAAMKTAKSGAYTKLSVYVSNLNSFKDISAIVQPIKPMIQKNVSSGVLYGKFAFDFEER